MSEFQYYFGLIIRGINSFITFWKMWNRSAYIREAVIYYYGHHGISTEEDDILDGIRKVVKECNSQLLNELDKRMESKNSIDYKKLKNMF